MKPLEERQQYVDYMSGKPMPASDFTHGALDIFGHTIWPDVVREECTRQSSLDMEGFYGEVYYQKQHPVELHPKEVLHLSRPTDHKRLPFMPQMSESAQRFIDEQRLKEVRKQLKNVKL